MFGEARGRVGKRTGRAVPGRAIIPRVHTTLSRATTEVAGLAAEPGSGREALRQLGIEVDRAKPEAGVAPVCPMLDGGGDRDRRGHDRGTGGRRVRGETRERA
jgi:hypothetical protein